MATPSPEDSLDQPGAGLPTWERIRLGGLLRAGARLMSSNQGLGMFRSEYQRIVRLSEEHRDLLSTIVLIARQTGIEDSSRNWSSLMVMEHLCMTTADILAMIQGLATRSAPQKSAKIADYKPSADVDISVIQRFADINDEYCDAIERLINQKVRLRQTPCAPHPWFGDLNAHQWHCLAAVHHRIHRKQMQLILAGCSK